MPSPTALIQHTQKWLSSVIIGHTLCPFAKREVDRGSIRYAVVESGDPQTQLEHVMTECTLLDTDTDVETTLLIFPNGLNEFQDYLDALDLANALLDAQGYCGIYQLASFHPDYRFEGVPPDDVSHYTNRSPYPIIHILREASVERVLKTYPHPDLIPKRNIEKMRGLGIDIMQGLLKACSD